MAFSAPKSMTGSKKLARLISREAEVLPLITEGKSNKETAMEPGISVKTVEKHRETSHAETRHPRHRRIDLIRHLAGIIEGKVQLKIV